MNWKTTRASARRATNTPGRRHFIMYKNNLRLWQWYKAKINGLWNIGHWPTCISQGRSLITLINNRKYNISPSNKLEDMKQNRWNIKYRSLTYIYLVRSIYMSHWSIIPTMMFINQIILRILNKITRPWNIGHVDLYLLWSQSLGRWDTVA